MFHPRVFQILSVCRWQHENEYKKRFRWAFQAEGVFALSAFFARCAGERREEKVQPGIKCNNLRSNKRFHQRRQRRHRHRLRRYRRYTFCWNLNIFCLFSLSLSSFFVVSIFMNRICTIRGSVSRYHTSFIVIYTRRLYLQSVRHIILSVFKHYFVCCLFRSPFFLLTRSCTLFSLSPVVAAVIRSADASHALSLDNIIRCLVCTSFSVNHVEQ